MSTNCCLWLTVWLEWLLIHLHVCVLCSFKFNQFQYVRQCYTEPRFRVCIQLQFVSDLHCALHYWCTYKHWLCDISFDMIYSMFWHCFCVLMLQHCVLVLILSVSTVCRWLWFYVLCFHTVHHCLFYLYFYVSCPSSVFILCHYNLFVYCCNNSHYLYVYTYLLLLLLLFFTLGRYHYYYYYNWLHWWQDDDRLFVLKVLINTNQPATWQCCTVCLQAKGANFICMWSWKWFRVVIWTKSNYHQR